MIPCRQFRWCTLLASAIAAGCGQPAAAPAPAPGQTQPAAAAPSERTLVVAVLTVQSSYKDNDERPAGPVPDTVQWWITPETTWRIKTFAIDHDVHIHSLDRVPSDAVDFAVANTKEHYGDVLGKIHVVKISNADDSNSIAAALAQAGLANRLEKSDQGFAFWNPDGGKYKTQSRPE
jgi:hypothetical protein